MRTLPRSLFFIGLFAAASALRAEESVRVFAAASLTNALDDIAVQWQKAGHPAPSLAFGASSTLAKQIEAGAPADLFAAADLSWMDYLGERGRIVPGSRINLLGNDLVLIVPKEHRFPVTMAAGFDLGKSFAGKLCTGEPGVVPVGTYARQALEYFGWWAALAARIVGTDDVRTALVFVERGEGPLGIVYATVALWATALCLPAGIATSWLLARRSFHGKVLLDALVQLPMVLPPVVPGYLLLLLFGTQGPLGAWLKAHLGIVIAFTWKGAALASPVIAFPLMAQPVRLPFRIIDAPLESVATTIGGTPWRYLITVTF